MTELGKQIPNNQELLMMQWKLADSPEEVLDQYIGFTVTTLLDRNIAGLKQILENLMIPAQRAKYNGWPQADTIQRTVAEAIRQLTPETQFDEAGAED